MEVFAKVVGDTIEVEVQLMKFHHTELFLTTTGVMLFAIYVVKHTKDLALTLKKVII
jgi:hypothetical protein